MSHWFAGLQDSCRALGDVLGSSNPECYIGPKQKCLGISELTCHLENQCWGANISIDIFQLNQHWNQMPHFIFAIIEVQCCLHPIHANPKLDIWKARICFLRSKVRGQLTRLALANWCVPESPLYSTLSIALWVQCVQIVLEYFQCFSSPVNFAFGTSILPVCFFSSFNFVFGTEKN